jgi:hypothetical protein
MKRATRASPKIKFRSDGRSELFFNNPHEKMGSPFAPHLGLHTMRLALVSRGGNGGVFLFDGCTHQIAPLRPRTVVILHVVVAQ